MNKKFINKRFIMDIIQQVVMCSCSNYIQWYLLLIISIRFLLDMKL